MKRFIAIVAVSVLLLILLATVSQKLQKNPNITQILPTKAPLRAFTVLTATADKQELTVGQRANIQIGITSGDNTVTVAQVELSYDPNVLAVEKVTTGTFFDSPIEYANKTDAKKGEILYAAGFIDGKKGTGVLATITVRALKKTDATEVLIKPTSIVTEVDNNESVLKESKGAHLVIR